MPLKRNSADSLLTSNSVLFRTIVAELLLAVTLVSAAAAQGVRKAPQAATKQPAISVATADQLAKDAERARTAGDSRTAIQLYQQALKARPSWSEGWWYLGTLQYDSDQYAAAIPAFERVVKLEPNLGAAWAFLGLCEFHTDSYQHSRLHLQHARELGVADAATARVADYHLAILLNLSEDFDGAAAVLVKQFGQEQLTPQVATAMGLSLLHMPVLPSQLDISKKELVYTAGQALMQISHKRHAEALDSLQQLQKQFPTVPFLHYSAALALTSLNRIDEALSELQAETQISSTNPEPYLLLAKIYLDRNDSAEALKAAQQASTLRPNNPLAHALLSKAYTAMGRHADAARELQIASSLGLPSSGLNTAPSQSTAVVAESAPHDATLNDPELAEIKRQATAAQQASDIEGAIGFYKKGVELHPNWEDGVLYLATLDYSTERYSEALPLAQRLVTLQPSVGMAWAMLGLCEFKIGNFEDSLVHLSRGRDLGFPQGGAAVSEANYHIGILFNRRGDFDAARSLLQQEAKAGERAEDAKFALGIALLRLRQLPSQIRDDEREMVKTAGDIAMDLGQSNYGPACAKFEGLLKQYPSRSYIYNAYGWTLMSISRFDAAVEQYRREIQVSPNAPEAYLGLATAAIKTNKFQEARDAAAKAVELDPDSSMAHGQYGRALVGLGELDKGIAELEAAVHIAVQIPELHYSLSRAYAKANRPKDAERERQIFLRLNKEATKK